VAGGVNTLGYSVWAFGVSICFEYKRVVIDGSNQPLISDLSIKQRNCIPNPTFGSSMKANKVTLLGMKVSEDIQSVLFLN
jgi:hypothetical protein